MFLKPKQTIHEGFQQLTGIDHSFNNMLGYPGCIKTCLEGRQCYSDTTFGLILPVHLQICD